MKHAVLGAGAIGGLMATALGYLGEDVSLIVRPDKLANYSATLTLEQPTGAITAPAHPVAKFDAPADVLWIATKTYQLQSALDVVSAAPGAVVPLLNGVDHIPVLRARFGSERVLPATIAVGADRLAVGRFLQGSVVRLSVLKSADPLLGQMLNRLQDRLGFICAFVENEPTLLWTKLCFLAPFALMTSASGKDKGGIMADPEWKAILYSAISETLAVAKAEGVDVTESHVRAILDGSPDGMRSSMLKDLIAGRRVELDGIGGPVARGGDKHGIPVPTTNKLITMIASRVGAPSPA